MKIASFEFTPEELARELTRQHHRTLYYLAVNEHITAELYYELIETTLVTSVKNDPGMTQRLLDKLFNREDSENLYSFPIADISQHPLIKNDEPTKPNLRLVKDE